MDARNVRRRPCRFLPAAIVLSISVLTIRASIADEPPKPDQIIDGFLAACSDNEELNEQQKKKVIDLISTLRKDESATNTAITEALRELHPDFAAALKALSDKDTGDVISRLSSLSAAEGPYLAAESSLLLAQAFMLDDDFEKALPLLEKVIEKHSEHCLRVGEARFLRGICELQTLKRLEAMASFGEFLERHPNAPARMLAVARQNLELLEQMELGSINDIHDQMEFSRRRLTLEDSGAKTQEVQDNVVAMLTSLIEEIEKKGGT